MILGLSLLLFSTLHFHCKLQSIVQRYSWWNCTEISKVTPREQFGTSCLGYGPIQWQVPSGSIVSATHWLGLLCWVLVRFLESLVLLPGNTVIKKLWKLIDKYVHIPKHLSFVSFTLTSIMLKPKEINQNFNIKDLPFVLSQFVPSKI